VTLRAVCASDLRPASRNASQRNRPVAGAIDATARQRSAFRRVRSSQYQLETLSTACRMPSSPQADGLVQWANQPMDRLVPRGAALQAP